MGSNMVLEHWGRLLLSLLFTHLVYQFISRRFFSPLSRFPGPFWGSITHLYSFFIGLSGKEHIVHYELHKKYGRCLVRVRSRQDVCGRDVLIALGFIGPIVRYKPDLLVISDPTVLPVIYYRYADKTDFYIHTRGVTTAFTSLKHADHVITRRNIAPSVRSVAGFWAPIMK